MARMVALALLLFCPSLATAGQTAGASERAHKAAQRQVIVFQAAVSSRTTYSGLHVEVVRLGEDTDVELTDDGSQPGDLAWDGVYTGQMVGDYSRYVNARLVGTKDDGTQDVLFAGMVRTDDRRLDTVGWQVMMTPRGWEALRVPVSYPGKALIVVSGLPLLVAYGWGALLLFYVFLLTKLRGTQP
ncbi:MAG: hypothetical protein GXP62_19650 [Oligoflexia bacterium]|nr:hypothetical protein [Oligoflexia bacterium]